MQIVKIKFSRDDGSPFEKEGITPKIIFREVMQVYQYNRFSCFTLELITFKSKITNVEKLIEAAYHPTFFQILKQTDTQILCLLEFGKISGFWPEMISESFVLLPPVIIDENYAIMVFLIKDKLENFLDELASVHKSIEIISVNNIEKMNWVATLLMHPSTRMGLSYPQFTERQHEIALYATRHGYFERPKKIDVKAIAAHFNISLSAVYDHLEKVERTSMRYLFA